MLYEIATIVLFVIVVVLSCVILILTGKISARNEALQAQQESINFYDKELKQAAAEVRRIEAAMLKSPLQPIATAPKNGIEIDLWRGSKRFPGCRWGRCVSEGFEAWLNSDGEAIIELLVIPGMFDGTPTHWMPIPSGPIKDQSPTHWIPMPDNKIIQTN